MKVLSVASARPNFVKLAAVHHALKDREGIEHVIVHTGQHYDPLFSDIFFEQLDIPDPVVNLGIAGGTHDEVIAKTEEAIASVLQEQKPDIVLAYGDVNGAVGAAKAAKALGITLTHVEAGLRSFDTTMPEELNRIAIDEIADILLCSEQSGVDNLRKEKVRGSMHLVGNTMIDTLIRMMPLIDRTALPIAVPSSYGVVTMHRPSNVDREDDIKKNVSFLDALSKSIPLILPLHRRTKASLEKYGLSLPHGIIACEPLGYLPFLHLVKDSSFILTDSGGIQEEATFLKKRCFTLRRNTERPSTIDSGSNVLIDPANDEDRQKVIDFAKNPVDPAVAIPEMWDGNAGARIVDILYTS